MADIFQEVDEDIRRDKAVVLWRKYGIYAIIICVAIVVGTASRVGWREYKAAQQSEESARYVVAAQLLKNGEAAAAITAFQSLAAEASTGYSVIARFQAAAARIDIGDKAGAATAYDLIAADDTIDLIFRGLAKLQAVMLLINDGATADLTRRIDELVGEGSSWRYSGLEMQAILKLRDGDKAGARAGFKSLSEDAGVPEGIRNRAAQILLSLGGEG